VKGLVRSKVGSLNRHDNGGSSRGGGEICPGLVRKAMPRKSPAILPGVMRD